MRNTRQAAAAAAIAMRRRSDHGRAALAGVVDPITASFDVGDEVRTELAPQVVNVDLDRVAGDIVLESIKLLLDLGARPQAARVAHQQLDYRVLAGGQCRRLTRVADHPLAQIEHHRTDGERGLGATRYPARYGAQTRRQLIDVEGLDEVVVCAGIQAG